MAAWIGPHWQEERRGLVEDEEASRRRMVELLLGPFIASKTCHLQSLNRDQPTTLNLLPATDSSCPSWKDNMGCTHVELEPEMPLPAGWEKCLNLKTGSIYYLNRTTGAISVSDPRKQASLDVPCSRVDASTSPTTSELTVEASNELAICNSKARQHNLLNINEKPNSNVDKELDLNLSLHVGLCSSPKTHASPRDAGLPILHPSNAACPAQTTIKTSASTASAPIASSSSSSSSTSSPLSASLAFSHTILSSTELSQTSFLEGSTFFKQESSQNTRLAMRGSSTYGGINHHMLSDHAQSTGGMLPRKLAVESENLSTAAAAASMVTVACANCLMFVMLSKSNPRCPRCGSSCPEQMEFPQPPAKRAKLGFSF
ncbi:hypothetical protein GOP47_0030220 [Adiantum capillus-veneris]|nr:hypothetical protein GOP47_0030220 [Adiantum capillus-veneris]